MNNPFWRLKHYLVDQNDPKENHATECLAACLVFSEKIRKEFIRCLYSKSKCPLDKPSQIRSQIEVITQERTDAGRVDLLIRKSGDYVLVVEVKVGDQEDERHRRQLENYQKWLNDQKSEKEKRLFTLIRDPDPEFKMPGVNRHRWQDLYEHFKMALENKDWNPTERSLLDNLFAYLEMEEIVHTYKITDLHYYSNGLKAQRAIRGIFDRVGRRLKQIDTEFDTDPCPTDDKKERWPQLKIKHAAWDKIFGRGDNWKISLWFTVPPIWDAKKHDFNFAIELWLEEHRNDWDFIKPQLSEWFRKLKSRHFEWQVSQTWKHDLTEPKANEIQTAPKRIWASKSEGQIFNEKSPQGEEVLVKLLVDRTVQYAKVIKDLRVRR